MNDDVLQEHRIEPIISEFTADPALDSLYRQMVAVAKEFGWSVPTREGFEASYKEEMARKIHQ